jgi:hypothetical protein
MLNPHGSWPLIFWKQAKPMGQVFSQNVLHVHRLARTEQTSIEDSMGSGETRMVFGGELKSPGFDPLVPTAMYKGQIFS